MKQIKLKKSVMICGICGSFFCHECTNDFGFAQIAQITQMNADKFLRMYDITLADFADVADLK